MFQNGTLFRVASVQNYKVRLNRTIPSRIVLIFLPMAQIVIYDYLGFDSDGSRPDPWSKVCETLT
jgi:hypothetical protein